MVAATEECLGTTSSAFVEASLYQVVAAARLPNSGISEVAVNATLAFIEGAKPQGEVECAFVIQMACTHGAAMSVLGRLGPTWRRATRSLQQAGNEARRDAHQRNRQSR